MDIKIKEGYLPDVDGKPVIASCENCEWLIDDSDGPEYGAEWLVCTKEGKEHMSNLKGFPFKTSQKCCDLHYAHLIDWDEEHRRDELTGYGILSIGVESK